MGLILDSSILNCGRTPGETVAQILRRVLATQGEIETALSVVTHRPTDSWNLSGKKHTVTPHSNIIPIAVALNSLFLQFLVSLM